MIYVNNRNGLRWLVSSLLDVPHGMFTRHGGVSHEQRTSLDCALQHEQERTDIQENLRRIQNVLGVQGIRRIRQVHGDALLVLGEPALSTENQACDAILTQCPGIGLLIQQADCQAILLHDPVTSSIAAIHNGWRGTVTNIIGKTIVAMQREFGVDPADLRAVISPSLGPCCAQFVNHRQELPGWMNRFQRGADHFDFWQASAWQLQEAGLQERNIDITRLCTMCCPDFFSYRRARHRGGITGRNGSVISLPTEEQQK